MAEYKGFLKLAGFEEGEVQEVLPEWIEASEKLGLTKEDIRFAVEEWIPKYWNVNLLGIRKCIGAYIREIIDITKAEEMKQNGVKIIYGILPATVTNYYALKIAAGDNIFVSFPDLHVVTVLNSFFHKAHEYLEKAEENGMTFTCRHCALNKTRIGIRSKGIIPSPDVIWSWGFNCDEAPKTDEYIKCVLDEEWNYVVSRVPHDTYYGEADDEITERVEYVAKQLEDGMKQIEKVTGIKVTEEHLTQAIKDVIRCANKLGTLTSLICSADPQPLGGNELSLFFQLLSVPFNSGIKHMEEAIDIVIKEVREIVKRGEGVTPKGAPKVGCYFVPFCVPWLDTIFRENGVGLTFSTVLGISKKMLLPPSYKDPYMAAAEQWLRMPQARNVKYEADNIIEMIKENKPDAMLLGLFDFDRWLGGHQKIMVNIVEEITKVPHFYIEGDFWEDRIYRPEDLRTRIESICHFIRTNKMISDSQKRKR